jgi:hypothetical protein
MNNYFLQGILFLIISILGYVYNRWWRNNKKKKGVKLFGYDKTVRIVDDWGYPYNFGCNHMLFCCISKLI